jgi:hypothetical protein
MALEALDNISELGIPLFALYLLIFCNFSKETLGCKLQQRKSFLKVLLVTVADDMLANKITAAMGQLQALVDDADEAVR